MPKIQILDQDIANKIAAGEVVERPGSVIKELVENAIDAEATSITVEIRNGGVTYMRVTDNGCGMKKEDARCCFMRHATSKISNIADLYAISTLGFRGEALAAISAVSKIELITAPEGEEGTKLILEGGKELSCDDTGAPKGTTIIVRDLFYNTPARMKFLKSDRSESGYVAALMERLALSHPEISIRFIQDGKNIISTNGNGKLLDVIYSLWGKELTKGMLQADTEMQQIRVYGYVGEPTLTKPNRNYQLCYINGRLVRSQTVFAAIDQAYRNNLFHGRHAVCILKINLPYGLVDVNVHPNKMEVKFSNEKLIFEAVYYAIKNALNKQTLLKKDEPIKLDQNRVEPKKALQNKKDPFQAVTILQKPKPLIENIENEEIKIQPQAEPKPLEKISVTEKKADKAEEEDYFVSIPKKSAFTLTSKKTLHEESAPAPMQETLVEIKKEIPYRYIGEIFKTYILIESDDQLYLVDKHAAHERMIFEGLLKERGSQKISAQAFLVPEQIMLSPEELSYAEQHIAEFMEIGFEISTFGAKEILLRSRPVCLTNEGAADAFCEILNNWMHGGKINATERENTALKTVACKAAIKAGNLNDTKELRALVTKLIEDDEVHQCPHGRPVMIAYDKKTIEKAFKRI
ncbi:MAG: DNA mismatch repair endonuclease MutL [Clostridia bacterium]|nr:DNA mismatch repair endonuclease MutL [Clostridia bacterium]